MTNESKKLEPERIAQRKFDRRVNWFIMGFVAGAAISYAVTWRCMLLLRTFRMMAVEAESKARFRASGGCINSLRQLSGAKDQYPLDHNGKTAGSVDDLVPTYITRKPRCPAFGGYLLNKPGEDPTCSYPGHTI
jgi:hypothetical protein